MALTGECYVGVYEGHTVELIRNNWVKTLSLWLDGRRVAWAMTIWPRKVTLTGTLEHDGIARAVVARAVPRRILWSTVTVEADGKALALTKKY
jgi:hypothetical protein